MLKVLVACEESQRVCMAFRELGHEAYSCDIIEPSGGHPEWHILGDVLEVLNPKDHLGDFEAPDRYISFRTMDGNYHEVEQWDLVIAHPPCTYLCNSGERWFNIERYGEKAIKRHKNRAEAAEFFLKFANAECEHIAIENPVGYMSTHYRKADQIVQPFEYGYPARKATCLWLKGLPKLEPTKIVPYETECGNYSKGLAAAYARDENGKILRWNDPETAKQRSKTVPGIAKAMADQWSKYLTGSDI